MPDQRAKIVNNNGFTTSIDQELPPEEVAEILARDNLLILVTSLDSQADKARGIEMDVNAYVVKGEFDWQLSSNLRKYGLRGRMNNNA